MNKILFRDFVAHYMSSYDPIKDFREAEPLVVTVAFDDGPGAKFLFTAEWSDATLEEMKMFVSPEIYNSYVDKFYLTDDGRIGITLTGEWGEEDE